jgi:hypothetical protein
MDSTINHNWYAVCGLNAGSFVYVYVCSCVCVCVTKSMQSNGGSCNEPLCFLERDRKSISVRMWFYMILSLSKISVKKSKLSRIMKSVEHKDEVKSFDCHLISLSRAPLVILHTSKWDNWCHYKYWTSAAGPLIYKHLKYKFPVCWYCEPGRMVINSFINLSPPKWNVRDPES